MDGENDLKIISKLRNFFNLKNANLHNSIGVFGLMLVLFWFFYNYNGEHIQAGNGVGWDGQRYAEWLRQSIFEIISGHRLDSFSSQRIVPSLIINFFTHWFGVSVISSGTAVHAFYIYNCIILSISALFLWLISKHFQWNQQIFFLAFSACYLNFAILKFSTFYPVLTDCSAMTMGIIIFYCYLKNKILLLSAATIFASFIYPSMLYTSLPLILFGINMNNVSINLTYEKLNSLTAKLIGFCAIFSIIYLVFFGDHLLPNGDMQINVLKLPLTILCTFLYLFLSLRSLIEWSFLKRILSCTNFYRMIIATITFLFVKILILLISNGHASVNVAFQIWVTLLTSVVNPFVNIVSHVNYYGPLLLLTIFFWREICLLIKKMGLGMMLFIMVFVIMGLESESRHLINAWPVFVCLTCEILKGYKLTWRITYSIIVLSLILSRFWLKINIAPWDSLHSSNFLDFPMQMYFMTQGPWLSNKMYFLLLFITLIVSVIVSIITSHMKRGY